MQSKRLSFSSIHRFNSHRTSEDFSSLNYQKLFLRARRQQFNLAALIFLLIHRNFVIILRKTLCNSLRFVSWNLSSSAIDFHDCCELNLIMTHINSVFKKSSRFIDVEEIQKESIHVIDNFFARRHNANKIRHFETQALVERNI